jgi:hypothetical protein
MEISNDIACTLNWVQIQFNSIGIKFNSDSWFDMNSNTLIGIWSELPICRKCHFQHQEYPPKDLRALGYGLGFNAQYSF